MFHFPLVIVLLFSCAGGARTQPADGRTARRGGDAHRLQRDYVTVAVVAAAAAAATGACRSVQCSETSCLTRGE